MDCQFHCNKHSLSWKHGHLFWNVVIRQIREGKFIILLEELRIMIVLLSLQFEMWDDSFVFFWATTDFKNQWNPGMATVCAKRGGVSKSCCWQTFSLDSITKYLLENVIFKYNFWYWFAGYSVLDWCKCRLSSVKFIAKDRTRWNHPQLQILVSSDTNDIQSFYKTGMNL